MLRQIRLHHEDIGAFRETDEIRIRPRVARDDDRLLAGIESIAECRLHRCVIDLERRDAHAAVVVDHAFADDVRFDRCAGRRMFFDEIASNVNVVRKESQHCIGKLLDAARSVKLQRRGLAPELPRRDEDVRKSGRVIGMQMCDEDAAKVLVFERRPGHPHRRPTASVDEKPLVAGDDCRRGAGVIRIRPRIAGAEKNHGQAKQ